MAGNDRDGAFVPGLYSNTARQTEFGISLLRAHCEFDNDTTMEETPRVKVKKPKVSRNQQEKSSTRLTKMTIGQHRVEKAMRAKAKEAEAQARQSGSGGDLARAIQEKLGQKIAASQPQEERDQLIPIIWDL
ncbi:unnamed protein product [Effrenium voratum]|nr:unnamed protein product [Effrenium voratum]